MNAAIAPVVVAVSEEGSTAAVTVAVRESLRTGRPVELVRVAPVLGEPAEDPGHVGLRRAEDLAHELGGVSLTVHAELLRGSVVPMLVHAARNSALVVVERPRSTDTHRRETSTVESLADAIDVPVLVVPAGWSGGAHHVVAVGLDPWAVDDSAVRAAITQARLGRSALRVLVAHEVPSSGSVLREALAERIAALGGDACDLAIEMVVGDAEQVLLDGSRSSDLLVLGRHRPADPVGSRLGPVARSVLRATGCPILLTTPAHRHVPRAARGAVRGVHHEQL